MTKGFSLPVHHGLSNNVHYRIRIGPFFTHLFEPLGVVSFSWKWEVMLILGDRKKTLDQYLRWRLTEYDIGNSCNTLLCWKFTIQRSSLRFPFVQKLTTLWVNLYNWKALGTRVNGFSFFIQNHFLYIGLKWWESLISIIFATARTSSVSRTQALTIGSFYF